MRVNLDYRAGEPVKAAAASPQFAENEDGELVPHGVDLIDPDDMLERRTRFYASAADQMQKSFPQTYGGLRMEVSDLNYEDPEDYGPDEQKHAVLSGGTLARRLRGTVHLFEEGKDEPIDKKRVTLMSVPHLTERGTFIHNGSDYVTISQSRLESGPYTRRRDNGELSTQFNVKPGTGRQFQVGFEPESAQYRLRVHGSNLHLYSMLKDVGVPDDQMEKMWGPEILTVNRNKYDPRVFEKAYTKFVQSWERPENATHEMKQEALKKALDKMQMNESIARRNLPVLWERRKQADYREPEPALFFPELTPDQVRDSLAPALAPSFRAKMAAFSLTELQAIATFLQRQTGKPIPVSGDEGQMEDEILAACTQGPTGVNAVMLQAAMAGLGQTKAARAAEDFTPDYAPDEIADAYNAIYGHVGPHLASMKQWPEHWLHPEDPMGWLQWYEQYHAGRRMEDDERQIRRWNRMRKLHGGLFAKSPTARRGFTLRNWAIDPLRLIEDPESRKRMALEMDQYRQDQTFKQQR